MFFLRFCCPHSVKVIDYSCSSLTMPELLAGVSDRERKRLSRRAKTYLKRGREDPVPLKIGTNILVLQGVDEVATLYYHTKGR